MAEVENDEPQPESEPEPAPAGPVHGGQAVIEPDAPPAPAFERCVAGTCLYCRIRDCECTSGHHHPHVCSSCFQGIFLEPCAATVPRSAFRVESFFLIEGSFRQLLQIPFAAGGGADPPLNPIFKLRKAPHPLSYVRSPGHRPAPKIRKATRPPPAG